MDNTSVSNITGKQKVFAILAYCGILWFLGLLNIISSDVRESEYVKNHVNNGMILFICEMFLACIPFLGWALEQNGEIIYGAGETITIDFTENLMLYAVWGVEEPSNWWIYLAAAGGAVVVGGFFIFFILWRRRRRNEKKMRSV